MEQTAVEEPIPISKVSGRYLLFDINVVTHLRRNHHILGVLTGSIPLAPQQNMFLGLPIELLPEEARVLVQKGIAYIVDDLAFHKQRLSSFEGVDRQLYLQSLRTESRKAQQRAQSKSAESTEKGLMRQAAIRAARLSSSAETARSTSGSKDAAADEDSLFSSGRPASPSLSTSSSSLSSKPWHVTPTTTYPPITAPPNLEGSLLPEVPVSFPLYAHLHEKGYYMAPGLRFGCHYSVYPGDPLRFHAHFLGVGYEWDQEIPLMDVVGGGRLGTGVKKGYLMGGEDTSKVTESEDACRLFTVEWGGM